MINDPLAPNPPTHVSAVERPAYVAPAPLPPTAPASAGAPSPYPAGSPHQNTASAVQPITTLDDHEARIRALEVRVGGAAHVPDPFPRMLYHSSNEPRTVHNAGEEKLLIDMGWTRDHVQVVDTWDRSEPTLHRSPVFADHSVNSQTAKLQPFASGTLTGK